MSESNKKHWKKRAAAGAVAAATSAGVLVGGAFDAPADFLNDDDAAAAAVTVCPSADEDDAGQTDEDKIRKASPLRQWFLHLPWGVRALVGVPLWAVGWGLLSLFGLLGDALLAPLAAKILGWLLTAAATLGISAATAKAIFPHLPLRKFFNRRTVLIVVGGMLLLGLADTVLPLVWKDYPPISSLLHIGGSVLLAAAGCFSVRRLARKYLPHREDAADKPAEVDPRTPVERKAMELANSVCPDTIPRP
jgi:hypothetical protein